MKLQSSIGLLYDSVSPNTGDIAIGIALRQALFERGVNTDTVNPFNVTNNPPKALIIGGGELLRDPGDEFYDSFRVPGRHILNSVGVSGNTDFSYLNDYVFISARSKIEAAVLQPFVDKKVHVLPCTTTILKSDKYTIPGINVKKGEKIIGIHLVPDVLIRCPDLIKIINEIPHKKVLIPFTHYNEDASFMKSLPIDMSNAIILGKLDPLELHSVISQMDYVIVSSLHASIFAFTQNVPFISMHQEKTHNYFKDRNLEKYVYSTQDQLTELIADIEANPPNMKALVAKDKDKVNGAMDTFVDLIGESEHKSMRDSNKRKSEQDMTDIKKLTLSNKQLRMVIEKRDVLMHNLIYQGIRSNEEQYKHLSGKIDELKKEVETLQTLRGYVRRTISRKMHNSSIGKKG